MEKIEYTNEEFKFFDELEQDLIMSLFQNNDKRFAITITIKKAFLKGLFSKRRISKQT